MPGLRSAPPCPPLGDLDYRALELLPTASKMSEIVLATDRHGQTVVLKIACVQQRARAEANRRAIHNSVFWLQRLPGHQGIAQMQPIQRQGNRGLRARFSPPLFVTTLPDWPDQPDLLVTEYLPGGTLSDFVGKRPLPIALALGLACDLARTLADLHRCGCVHRDLKPENILFRVAPSRNAKPSELQPVLIDFGVAAASGEPKLIAGSPLWMAPELQTAAEKSLLPVDPSWDVYALGLICCYLLSGLRPQRQQHDRQDYIDYRERVFAQLQQTTEATNRLGRQGLIGLQQGLSGALDQEPRQRPTAAELAATFADLLAQMETGLAPAQASSKVRFSLPLQRWYLAGITLVALLILVISGWVWGRGQTSPQLDPPDPQPPIAQLGALQVSATLLSASPPPTLAAMSTFALTASSVTQHPSTASTPGTIRLIAPDPGANSAQERVAFMWENIGPALAATHCYALVFWDPANTQDKRSPIAVSQTQIGLVNFGKLGESADPLLRSLIGSPQGFEWGVRIVDCAAPAKVVQDVEEVRHYRYQP